MRPHCLSLPSENTLPFSFIPFCPRSPFLRSVSSYHFWSCFRPSGQWKTPWPMSSACSMGSQLVALAWQPLRVLTTFFLKHVAPGFPQYQSFSWFPSSTLWPLSPHPWWSLCLHSQPPRLPQARSSVLSPLPGPQAPEPQLQLPITHCHLRAIRPQTTLYLSSPTSSS